MNPNELPAITLPDGRSAIEVFGEFTVDEIWPHVLVPASDSPAPIAESLHQLAAADAIPQAWSSSFEELAQALWDGDWNRAVVLDNVQYVARLDERGTISPQRRQRRTISASEAITRIELKTA